MRKPIVNIFKSHMNYLKKYIVLFEMNLDFFWSFSYHVSCHMLRRFLWWRLNEESRIWFLLLGNFLIFIFRKKKKTPTERRNSELDEYGHDWWPEQIYLMTPGNGKEKLNKKEFHVILSSYCSHLFEIFLIF